MPEKTEEELGDGSTQIVDARISYRDPSSRFITREDYLARRVEHGLAGADESTAEEEEPEVVEGYGTNGYGSGDYGN